MGSKKKWLFNAGFLILILGLTFWGIFRDENPRVLLRLLDRANGWYWILGFGIVVLFVSCESLILRLLLNHVGEPPPKGHCLLYSFVGFFFSAITPAAGGGQPAQVYFMHKDGLNPGTTAPVLVVVTVCYKLVLVLFGLAVLITRPPAIALAHDGALWWCFIGWVCNVVAITGLLLLIFLPDVVERLALRILDWVSRWIRVDRVAHWREKLEHSLGKYREVTDRVQKNVGLFLLIIVISIVQRALLFFVTWLVLRSFGIGGSTVAEIITMQAMVSLGTDLIPLPGGSGANEALFLLLFEGLCGETLVLPVLMATRGITYFGQLLICGAMTVVAGLLILKRRTQ